MQQSEKRAAHALKVLVLNASLDDIERLGHSDGRDLRRDVGQLRERSEAAEVCPSAQSLQCWQ